MRIAVVRTDVPFVTGGAERHADNLVAALAEHGHEAAVVAIPFRWNPGTALVEHVMAAKLIDLEHFVGDPVDLMIGLKFPAWLARHPNRIFWVLHQHRQAYDLWDSGISDLLHDPDGAAVRGLIRDEDARVLGAPGAKVWANSGNVADRLKRYNGIKATPLYHPPPNAERLRAGETGDYLFAPGRLNPLKRQDLMIEALAEAVRDAPAIRLVLAGPSDDRAYTESLKQLAEERGVGDRVTFTGAIPDAEMVRLYAEARAVVFTPVDEDYGYITLEGMLSGKALVVTTDSGGPLEFIRDGQEGFVTAPEPAALGTAFARLSEDRAQAETMGAAGAARYRALKISWETVVATLTGRT
ncbi:MAG: glycosyltransferase family 4 protein, partial [Pseudomonadota bacterium]